MNTKPIIIAEPFESCIKWALVIGGQIQERGDCKTLENLRDIEKQKNAANVWIENGYRTAEINAAASFFNWFAVRARSKYTPANMINDMIKTA